MAEVQDPSMLMAGMRRALDRSNTEIEMWMNSEVNMMQIQTKDLLTKMMTVDLRSL
jgi:hypothetical protein